MIHKHILGGFVQDDGNIMQLLHCQSHLDGWLDWEDECFVGRILKALCINYTTELARAHGCNPVVLQLVSKFCN